MSATNEHYIFMQYQPIIRYGYVYHFKTKARAEHRYKLAKEDNSTGLWDLTPIVKMTTLDFTNKYMRNIPSSAEIYQEYPEGAITAPVRKTTTRRKDTVYFWSAKGPDGRYYSLDKDGYPVDLSSPDKFYAPTKMYADAVKHWYLERARMGRGLIMGSKLTFKLVETHD